MNYTDRFFKFPIRIYDRFSVQNSERREDQEGVPHEGEYVIGLKKLYPHEIIDWQDYYDSEYGVEGVTNEGFKDTLVFTRTCGIYVCPLKMEKFEELLNSFMERVMKETIEEEKYMEIIVGKVIERMKE